MPNLVFIANFDVKITVLFFTLLVGWINLASDIEVILSDILVDIDSDVIWTAFGEDRNLVLIFLSGLI